MAVTQYPYYGSLQAQDGSGLRITNGDGTATPVHGTWLVATTDGNDSEGRPQISRLTIKLADGKVYSEAVDPATGKPLAGSMMFYDRTKPAENLSEKMTAYDKMSVDQISEGEQILGAALGSYMSARPASDAQKPEAKPAVARAASPEKIDPKLSGAQAKILPNSASPAPNQGMPASGYRGTLKGMAYNESEQKILADAARHPHNKKKVQAAQLLLEERDVDTGNRNHQATTAELDGIAGTLTKKGLKEALAQIHQQGQLAKKTTTIPKASS